MSWSKIFIWNGEDPGRPLYGPTPMREVMGQVKATLVIKGKTKIDLIFQPG